MQKLIDFTSSGLYCPIADLYIDPWKPVEKAIITHAHSDHARIGNRAYLTHKDSVPLLKNALGQFINIQALDYGETINVNGVTISLHPAGHIIGSSQVRLEYKGEVWVVSGDYKLDADGLSVPFEPIQCDTFVTESAYGLPVFKWGNPFEVYNEINEWWAKNLNAEKNSVLLAYNLGKAQRLLHNLDLSIGEVYVHHTIENINQVMRENGINIPLVKVLEPYIDIKQIKNSLILAPPSSLNSPWVYNFNPCEVAITSGWANLRQNRRRKNIDKGFILSDHADWKQLKETIKNTNAQRVYITNGFSSSLSRWLQSESIFVEEIKTEFKSESDEINDGFFNGLY